MFLIKIIFPHYLYMSSDNFNWKSYIIKYEDVRNAVINT